MKKLRVSIVAATVMITAALVFTTGLSAQNRSRSNDVRQPARTMAPASIMVENFDYPAASLLSASGWTAHSGAGTNPLTVTAPGLTYAGWPSAGNSVAITTSGEDAHRTFPAQTTGSVYAGLLVNVSDAFNEGTGIGGYFFHLGPDPIGTTFRGRVFIKKDASNNVSFGFTKASSTTAADIVYTPFTYSLNTTYLLIVKYTIVDGVTNDTCSLFINPALGGAEPSATLTATDVIASDINPGSFAIRQGTATTHPTVRVDGIRVSTSWSSLVTAPTDANADFNGDGKTDFIVARATASPFGDGIWANSSEVKGQRRSARTAVPQAPQIYWYTSTNGSGATSVQPWGDAATDFIITEDFDGDGKDDLAVWREAPATQAAFYVFQSSNNTLKLDIFGQTGDDPAIVGDYDGDGKADPAVYRCPAVASPAGQCFFFYRGSNANPSGNITYVPWGSGNDGDFFPYVGDFDGDGKNDFCVQRTNPAQVGQGQFVLLKSNGFGVEYINWGSDSDFLIPGDYDGDGRTDICVRRTESGVRQHYILTRTGATSQIQWGITGDASVPGDYDGDGKTDLAIWRPSTDPAANFFWVRNSGNGAVSQFEWGQCPTGNCDFAVAGWAVH